MYHIGLIQKLEVAGSVWALEIRDGQNWLLESKAK